ncbi:MAG TPA: hypothetical protein DEQ30_04865 [Porphyromonadaceae bacterium]|nr:hypothetical protein [Porphyromonadaceae bacterium]
METKTYEELEKIANEIKKGDYNAEQIGDLFLGIIDKIKSIHKKSIESNLSDSILTERMVKKNFIIDELKMRDELK